MFSRKCSGRGGGLCLVLPGVLALFFSMAFGDQEVQAKRPLHKLRRAHARFLKESLAARGNLQASADVSAFDTPENAVAAFLRSLNEDYD